MKVLSLFDGMSCGQIALKKLGLTVDEYYASEIDKYAIQVTQTNFPKTIQVGDVSLLDPNDFQDIDLMLAGSPCQGFSFAGKQLAFDDPRSALFFEFIRLLKAIKPKYFLLENVRMKKEFLEVITQEVSKCYPNFSDGSDLFENRIEPILINSSLLSAQSRQRYYWTNIPGIEQPEDKGIVLKDILEQDPDEISTDGSHIVSGAAFRGRAYDKCGKRMDKDGDSVANKTKQMLELRQDRKSNAITTVYKDSVVVEKSHPIKANYYKSSRANFENDQSKGGKFSATGVPVRSKIRNKSKTVRSGGRDSYDRHEWDSVDELHWRKLTPLECERLQTVPDNYTAGVSNTQRYKMLGNGWTVDVIAHILANMDL